MLIRQEDTTWTLVLSPIVISGQVDVRTSATLTVEPGVNVVFTDQLATIEVFGMCFGEKQAAIVELM